MPPDWISSLTNQTRLALATALLRAAERARGLDRSRRRLRLREVRDRRTGPVRRDLKHEKGTARPD